MTLEETRQLGIEFERRVQTMIPEKEFDKLDTETIYSFLNQYQDKYVHDIYRSLDRILNGNISASLNSMLQSLLVTTTIKKSDAQSPDSNTVQDGNGISIVDTARSYTFKLPADHYMYIKSVSQVSSTYSFKGHVGQDSFPILPNVLVSQKDVQDLVETPRNSMRILRNPIVVLNQKTDDRPTITVIIDRYTTLRGIRITYYKEPSHFSILDATPCELPSVIFEDLVSGAVDMYVQYVAGAEARKRQQDEAAKRNAQQNRRNNQESNNE